MKAIRTPKIIIGSIVPDTQGENSAVRPAQGKNVAMKLYTRDEARLAAADTARLSALLRKT